MPRPWQASGRPGYETATDLATNSRCHSVLEQTRADKWALAAQLQRERASKASRAEEISHR
jgi:hypothetical protein